MRTRTQNQSIRDNNIALSQSSSPMQFRATVHAELADGSSFGANSLLLVIHYDFPNQRTREDYYYYREQTSSDQKVVPEVVYTSIKAYAEGRNYMIFHGGAFRNTSLQSPHSCFVGPLSFPLLAPDALRHAAYVGLRDLLVGFGTQEKHAHTAVEVPTIAWNVRWDDASSMVFLSSTSESMYPLRVESSSGNYTVLDFDESSLSAPAELFDPQAHSTAKCAPLRRNAHRHFA